MSQIKRSLTQTGIKPYLKKVVMLDSHKYPLFGGEPVHLEDYILSKNGTYSEEDDIYTQQRIACARGVVMLNYNDFPVEVQEKMSYIKDSIRNVQLKGTDKWVAKEGEILTYTPTVYFQHVRNRLLAKKMVEIEEDLFMELQASGHPYSDKSALDSKKSLFKAWMIECERHVCQRYGGSVKVMISNVGPTTLTFLWKWHVHTSVHGICTRITKEIFAKGRSEMTNPVMTSLWLVWNFRISRAIQRQQKRVSAVDADSNCLI